MIRKSWSAKSIFRCTWPRPKTFARRPTRAGSFGPKPRRYYAISDPVFFQLVISCRSNYKESFSPASHLREGFFFGKDARNLLRLLSKRQDNYFLFVGKRQQKFLASASAGSTLVLLAAKKHLARAAKKKAKVLLSLFDFLAIFSGKRGRYAMCFGSRF